MSYIFRLCKFEQPKSLTTKTLYAQKSLKAHSHVSDNFWQLKAL